MNYVSLFSSAGVGCYGLKMEGFDCVATSELVERRLNVQRANNKVKYDEGYILGDITEKATKARLYSAIQSFKSKENISDVDVVIFTAPCQGMSVANHKKNAMTIARNSLVVEALEIVSELKPKIFIAENVRAFMNSKCIDYGVTKKIEQAFNDWIGNEYTIVSRVLNFKNYGANSSRTRTLAIGVRNDLSQLINVEDLFPREEKEKTLYEVIGELPSLSEIGEVHEKDIFHGFKQYREDMRDWIREVKPGFSAFDNEDISKRPHTINKMGDIVINTNKNGDKYTRQRWDVVAPCIHTRNDILASQNTVHPVDDRVFSIRELMLMMNIPQSFKWSIEDEDKLNNMSIEDKLAYLKKNEINIRQSIGEAIPTIIIQKIAKNIKGALDDVERKNNKGIDQDLQASA